MWLLQLIYIYNYTYIYIDNILVGLRKSDDIIFLRPQIPATLFILVGLPVAGCGWVTNYPGLDCSKHYRLKPHVT